jgi:hypothetical protein
MPRVHGGDADNADRLPVRDQPGFSIRLPVDPRAILGTFSKDPVPGEDPESSGFMRPAREESGPGFHGMGIPDRPETVTFAILSLFDIIYITGRY